MKTKKSGASTLFTGESLMSLHGASAATLITTNVLTYLIGVEFQRYEKWAALAVAMLLAFYLAIQSPGKQPIHWVVALFNGLLIFAAASGLTQALGSLGRTEAGVLSYGAPSGPLPFFHSWYP